MLLTVSNSGTIEKLPIWIGNMIDIKNITSKFDNNGI